MPEDIPETEDFSSCPPPTDSNQDTGDDAGKRPDFVLLASIGVGVFGVLLLTLLIMDGIGINWQWSAFIYLIIMIGVTWSFLEHGIPHMPKPVRIGVALIIVILIGGLGVWGTLTRYHIQHLPPRPLTDPNFVNSVKSEFNLIKTVLATNPAIASDSQILILESNKLDDLVESQQIQVAHEVLNFSNADITAIRAKRTNDFQRLENSNRFANDQKREEEIKQQKQEQEEEKAASQLKGNVARNERENEELRARELVEDEKLIANQIIPVFDYAIRQLNESLQKISTAGGGPLFTNFRGSVPDIYASDYLQNGILASHTNFLSIGTNSAWNFCIETSVNTPRAYGGNFRPPMQVPIRIIFKHPYIVMKIVATNNDTESSMTITPTRTGNGDLPDLLGEDGPIQGIDYYPTIKIEVLVTNGLSETKMVPFKNYKGDIDEAIWRLLGAQDQQFPITKPN